ncbi:MAG: class I SAM-dependent methyltransferase [Gammaproteobacteria bacterium]|nr:class I SAM-dependent methyltransferase [Gammaproteobacteria bacterium]
MYSTGYTEYLKLVMTDMYVQANRIKTDYIMGIASEHASMKGKMLDIGCGAGELLRAAAAADWLAYGIEANGGFIAECHKNGFNVEHGFFPDSMKNGEKYELITMLDVLEHMENPVEFACKAKEYLANSGMLVIQVPNLNSLFIRLEGCKNTTFCPGHWSYFTPATLTIVLRQAGFECVFSETIISEFDKIKSFPDAAIKGMIKQLTGNEVNMADFSIDWLHANLLGYKILAVYKKLC